MLKHISVLIGCVILGVGFAFYLIVPANADMLGPGTCTEKEGKRTCSAEVLRSTCTTISTIPCEVVNDPPKFWRGDNGVWSVPKEDMYDKLVDTVGPEEILLGLLNAAKKDYYKNIHKGKPFAKLDEYLRIWTRYKGLPDAKDYGK